jgi:hypothetical protein
LTIGVELLILICWLYVRQIQINGVDEAFEFMTESIARSSWLAVKKNYVHAKSAFFRKDLRTYRRLWKRQFFVRNYIALMEGRALHQPPKGHVLRLKQEVMPENPADLLSAKEFYRTKVEQSLNSDQYDLDNLADMTTLLFEMQVATENCFMDEMMCMVSFLLTSTMNADLAKRQKQKEFFNFLQQRKEIFHALNIQIQIPPTGSLSQKTDVVQAQIEGLEPDKEIVFNQIYQLHLDSERQQAAANAGARAAEEEKRLRRESASEQARQQKERDLQALREKIRQEREAAESAAREAAE